MPRGQYDRTAVRARKAVEGIIAEAAAPMPVPTVPVYPTLPARVRLTEAHGFVNDYDAVYFKPGGTVITNPVEIAILMDRGAPIEAC
jgi:hypothetical protein